MKRLNRLKDFINMNLFIENHLSMTFSHVQYQSISFGNVSPYVRVCLSSVQVAVWSPFGKELLTRLTICFLCVFLFYIYIFFFFWFWFLGSCCL